MGFVIATVVFTLFILAILTFPWWRPNRVRENPTLSADDLAAELQEDVATGALAAEDLEPAARDLEATTDSAGARTQKLGARRRWSAAVLALLLVPAGAAVLYWHFGDWRFALEGEHAAVVHRADTMIAELQAHQRKHPGDVQGWINLGQGAEAIGRYPLAASAFKHALDLKSSPDPDLLGQWGEVLLLSNPRQVTDQERQIFKRVLELDPDNLRGLWYGGLLALADGHREEAVKDWQRLLKQPQVAPQVADLVRQRLDMLGAAATAGQAAAAATGKTRLHVTVELAPGLKRVVKAGETLYVFVRDPQGGPPLAVRRLTVGSFPVRLTLDDHDAMLQGHDLSDASGPLEVTAHISTSGDAQPHPGDLQGSRKVKPGPGVRSATVVIDSRIGSSP